MTSFSNFLNALLEQIFNQVSLLLAEITQFIGQALQLVF